MTLEKNYYIFVYRFARTYREEYEMSTSKKKRKKRKIIIFVIEIILLLVVLAALFVWSKYQRMGHEAKIDTDDVTEAGDWMNTDMDESTQEVLSGYTNIAIFGLDNRSNGNFAAGNSDMIMIASINNDTKEVRVVSVYRDTFLNMNDDGTYNFHKANYAYNKGGAEEAVRMLNRNLDLDIKDYVVVDFEAVVEIIDLLGGIEVELDSSILKWMNTYIAETASITEQEAHLISGGPGMYTLDGVQATAYGRIRYGSSDYRRAQRQREVMAKGIEKAKSAGLLTINKIIDSVVDDISTTFTAMELVKLASQMFDYELVETSGFPYVFYGVTLNKKVGFVNVPCDLATNVTKLHQALFNDYNYTPSNTVLNYSSEIISETGYDADDGSGSGLEDDDFAQAADGGTGGESTAQDDAAAQ